MKRVKLFKKPWGGFKQFILNKKCTVKIITVKPRGVLSLQIHKKRSEQWYFLTDGLVQIGNKKKIIKKGSQITIKKNVAHRLFAQSKQVQVLEIAQGHFDKNDIIRLEDNYGRVNT